MISTFELHVQEEKLLTLVDFNEEIPTSDINHKIKLTYIKAIEEIYRLSLDPNYKECFCESNKKKYFGAALNKVTGEILVFFDELLKFEIFHWSNNQNWKKIDTNHDRFTINSTLRFDEERNTFLSFKWTSFPIQYSKINYICYAFIYEGSLAQKFIPIEEKEENESRTYTLSYNDLMNALSRNIVKNARSYIPAKNIYE